MQKSILDAIREGTWDYEPDELSTTNYDSTPALPGSAEKLAILATRAEQGLPLWHDADRRDYENLQEQPSTDQAGSLLQGNATRTGPRE
ncbi:MAG: hypothetical protein AAGG46_00735 [Planctomycetota bacterium]